MKAPPSALPWTFLHCSMLAGQTTEAETPLPCMTPCPLFHWFISQCSFAAINIVPATHSRSKNTMTPQPTGQTTIKKPKQRFLPIFADHGPVLQTYKPVHQVYMIEVEAAPLLPTLVACGHLATTAQMLMQNLWDSWGGDQFPPRQNSVRWQPSLHRDLHLGCCCQ